MVEASGRVAGLTSTDAVQVGGMTLDSGDYSGPGGARLLLRRPEVETAILETARGGILRRGLEVEQADVAVVTNIADDHLGEFGIQSLPELAAVKMLAARAVKDGGAVVLNADDAMLRVKGEEVKGEGGQGRLVLARSRDSADRRAYQVRRSSGRAGWESSRHPRGRPAHRRGTARRDPDGGGRSGAAQRGQRPCRHRT